MPSERIILFAGGGSGGHLYPGIAVAEVLAQIAPDVRPVFLCTPRDIDSTILRHTPFEFLAQPIVPPRRSIGGLIRFWRGWRQTQDLVRRVLSDRKPLAVLGLGGYAAGVAVKLSARSKIPCAILNPDVIPGHANQYLLAYVQRVCCQFDATQAHVADPQRKKLITTGCPIRQDIARLPLRDEAIRRLGLDPMLRTLVVTGASQGAVTVNEAVLESLSLLAQSRPERPMQGWQILHLAGKDNAESVRAAYRTLGPPSIVLDFTPAMSDVWAVADLAVARSGASTCAELTAAGVPSILMPYPFHKDMHQLANARVLAAAGAAEIVNDAREKGENARLLLPLLERLLYDANRRDEMSRAATQLAIPDAAARVARVLIEMMIP